MATTFFDSFQRVAANLGANWTNVLNGFSCNNAAKATAGGSVLNVAAYTGESFTDDQSSTVVIESYNGTMDTLGPAVSIQGIGSVSYYVASVNATTIAIQKIVGATATSLGTVTTLISAAWTGNPGDIITLSKVGNDLLVNANNVVGAVIPPGIRASDTSPLTGGSPGISQFGTTATFGSFAGLSQAVPAGSQNSLILQGDSITLGQYCNPIWGSILSLNGENWSEANVAIGSQCLDADPASTNLLSMITIAPTSVDYLYSAELKQNIVVIWGGTNDIGLNGSSASSVYASLQTYCAARQAAGFKVIVMPMCSRTSVDASIQAFNALLAANHSFADGIVNLPATLTGLGAYVNTTYFNADGVHPNQNSATNIIAPAVSVAINAMTGYSSMIQVASYDFSTVENPLSDGGSFAEISDTNFTAPLQVIAGNLCEPSAILNACGAVYVASVPAPGNIWPADQYSEVTVASLTANEGIIDILVRQGSPTSGTQYACAINSLSNAFFFYAIVSGSLHQLDTGPFTPSVGDVLRFAVVGNVLTLSQNGTPIQTFTDLNNYITSGSPGFSAYSNLAVTNTQISLWAAGANQAASPTFSPNGGTFSSAQTVTITSASGGTIYYTTDGSTPTHSSSSISSGGTITVGTTSTVKAIASATNFVDSTTASASFTITIAPTGAYSVPDCRDYGNFPNDSVNVNGTLTYTVPSVDSRKAGAPVDSRAAGAPVACGTYPQNSRTPGTFGPGE